MGPAVYECQYIKGFWIYGFIRQKLYRLFGALNTEQMKTEIHDLSRIRTFDPSV
jgi:hypothetical protein